MSKGQRTVHVASEEAIQLAERTISRDVYKAIKHMNKIEMAQYFTRVWHRGYEAGREAGLKEAKAEMSAAPAEAAVAEDKED